MWAEKEEGGDLFDWIDVKLDRAADSLFPLLEEGDAVQLEVVADSTGDCQGQKR